MGDMGDYWRDVKEHFREQAQKGRDRKNRNRDYALKVLGRNGVAFEVKSTTHVVIRHEDATYDYWPTTGKWVKRETNPQYKRGLKPLMSALGFKPQQSNENGHEQ